MAVKIVSQSAGFALIGDGAATSCRLPFGSFPFSNCPKTWTAASASVNANGGGNISGVSVVGDMVELTFASAFSGGSGSITIDLTFDLL